MRSTASGTRANTELRMFYVFAAHAMTDIEYHLSAEEQDARAS
ncbi:MAG TPA: hypothetical protein VLR26_13980 [Frankiaceae bacterium]|nr:hypothetical protein [Frankiaceae bacterium]